MVPRVGGGVLAAYDRLRAAGLRVSVPGGLSFDSLAPPRVGRVVPAAGRRVPRGSVVTLYLSRNTRRPTVPVGRLPKYVVAKFVGGAVSSAYGWVSRKRLDFRAYLGPLKAGSARGLFANYRVTRQRPAAGVRLALGQGKRPAKGRGGSFRLTPLTVWGAQPPTVAPCTPPRGSRVIASSAQAVLTATGGVADFGHFAWYGCLRAVGRERLLASADVSQYSGGPFLSRGVLAGRYAALQFIDTGGKYDFSCDYRINVYDLSTGTGNRYFNAACGPFSSGIDSLLLNPSGFAAWHLTEAPATPYTPLSDIACPSASLCVAVDGAGNAVTATDPTGGRNAWTIANIDGNAGLTGISCPSTSFCVAVGVYDIVTSTNPTGGSSAWTATRPPGANLFDVGCPSVSLCVGVGQGGITTSTDPSGSPSAWTTTKLPGNHDLSGVSCPSVSLCVAVDGATGSVLTSTNPTGGAAAWQLAKVDTTNFLTGISCPSASLCVASDDLGRILTSTNPTGGPSAWSLADVHGGFLTRVSCPSISLCVSVGLNGIATSTNPTGGAGAWTITQANDGLDLVGVACPSASLCVAVSNRGRIVTSINPTAGATAWTTAVVDASSCAVSTPCVSEQLWAHDDQGTKLIDSAPPSTGKSLTNVMLSGNLLIWNHDGTPHQATLR